MQHVGEGSVDAAAVRRVFIAILLTVLVVGARAPFLGQMLIGEEGSFAALVASKTPSSQITPNHMPQMFIGEVRGQPMFAPFQHNIMPYVLLERGGGALVRAQHLEAATPERIEVGVRLSYFAFFAVGVAGLLWMAAQSISKALVGAFALTTPSPSERRSSRKSTAAPACSCSGWPASLSWRGRTASGSWPRSSPAS